MAWFVATLVVCWYVESGQYGPQAQRHRPWYKDKETPTFADVAYGNDVFVAGGNPTRVSRDGGTWEMGGGGYAHAA